MMPGPGCRNSDEDFRMLYNETDKTYHIQKKRYWWFGWKMLNFKFYKRGDAFAKLHALRAEALKRRTKKVYVIIEG